MTNSHDIAAPTVTVELTDDVLGTGEYSAELILSLEEDGSATLRATECHSSNRNSTRMSVWHQRELEWSQRLSQGAVALPDEDKVRALADSLAPLVQRVHAGHEVDWDGSNMTGRLTSGDAAEASCAIECTIEAADWTRDGPIWAADDWARANETDSKFQLQAVWDMTEADILAATAKDVARLAREGRDTAKDAGVVLYGDLEEALTEMIAEARENIAEAR